jgi:hypothetical protein
MSCCYAMSWRDIRGWRRRRRQWLQQGVQRTVCPAGEEEEHGGRTGGLRVRESGSGVWVWARGRGGVRAAGVAGGAMGSACCGRGKGGAATGYTASVLAEGRGGEGATSMVWMCVRACRGRTGGVFGGQVYGPRCWNSYAAGAGIGAQRGARHPLPQPLWGSGLMRFSRRLVTWRLVGLRRGTGHVTVHIRVSVSVSVGMSNASLSSISKPPIARCAKRDL